MDRFRSHGWKAEELKIYWNAQQLEDLCPQSTTDDKEEEEAKKDFPPHDPSDVDAVLALRQNPVSKRNFDCKIEFIHQGIERAVFDAPKDAQLIVLNFAVSLFLSNINFNHQHSSILERTISWRWILKTRM